jgi:hypothetical protein
MPWGYWCEESIRQKVLSRISEAGDLFDDNDMMPTEVLCRKYMAEKSSDSLKDSIEEFFSNNDIIDEDTCKGIIIRGVLRAGNPEEIYNSLFSPKSVSQFHNGSIDSD